MVAVESTMLELGTKAPDFALPDTTGKTVRLSDFDDAACLVVMFICNHCPFVKHIRHQIASLAEQCQHKGVAFVAINANDVEKYPDDRPEKMAEEVKKTGYTFPYLFDESQDVAKRYKAACTPDFYVFDKDRKLVYRGQFDDSRPESDAAVTGTDLRRAIEAALEGKQIPAEQQQPSIGCNIKWKPGNEPAYFQPS